MSKKERGTIQLKSTHFNWWSLDETNLCLDKEVTKPTGSRQDRRFGFDEFSQKAQRIMRKLANKGKLERLSFRLRVPKKCMRKTIQGRLQISE
jgi:hypothetical protein